MSFGHPWMLLGLGAALIPLLVHLFDRRRPRPHPFAAISFVLRSQRRTASRLKLKRLILYTLRTLVFLAVPLALARPELRRAEAAGHTARGPAATSIVLDASLSMRYAQGGTSSFDRARDEARAALRALSADEPANVVLCTNAPQAPGAPTFDRGSLRSKMDDAEPTYAPADLNRCLDLAAHSLEDSPLEGKRLVVISDFTQPALHLEAPAPTVAGKDGQPIRPEVVLRDVARGELPNHGIVDLKIDPAPQAGPRAFAFTFTVKNFSGQEAKEVEASLKVGGQVRAKGFLTLPAHGTAQKTLTYRFDQSGRVDGEVQLAPDGLAEDDRRAFVVDVPKDVRALVINGAPNAVRYRDEAFFVDAALSAPGAQLRDAVRDPEAAFREDFSQYELIFLLNAPVPTAEQAARLIDFVQKGGGLFISMGDQVDFSTYNARLGEVLPRPLRDVRTAVNRDDPDAESRAAKLGAVNIEHPLFSPFVGRANEGLSTSRFYRYVLCEAGFAKSGEGSEVVASYEDGAPAVVLARRGKGRVLLFTSTVDRDWADFAIRTSFLPFLQRAAAYLVGSLDEHAELKAHVGESVRLDAQAAAGISTLIAPSGAKLPLRTEADGARSAGPLTEPGVYKAAESPSGQPVSFPVLLDATESDLSRLPPDALAAYFGEDTVTVAAGQGRQAEVPIWTWLILAAALAFFFEGVLLRS